jgi:hypothetical protein
LPGILIEIDPRHGTASARDRRNGYANKNNKQLQLCWLRSGRKGPENNSAGD